MPPKTEKRTTKLNRRYGHMAPLKAKTRNLVPFPAWVDAIEDRCLEEVVREALSAKSWAVSKGALDNPKALDLIRRADEGVEAIERGDAKGHAACRRAASAARKYNSAGEIALASRAA
jgi:hypothetical protein